MPKPTSRPSWFIRGNEPSLAVGNAIGRTESKRFDINFWIAQWTVWFITTRQGRWQHNNSQIVVRINRIETRMNKSNFTFDISQSCKGFVAISNVPANETENIDNTFRFKVGSLCNFLRSCESLPSDKRSSGQNVAPSNCNAWTKVKAGPSTCEEYLVRFVFGGLHTSA